MKDALPGFRSFLTDIEYCRVKECAHNLDKVDEFVDILLTKEKKEFEEFLVVLLQQGYANTAAELAENAGGCTMSEDLRACIPHSEWSSCTIV